VAISFASRPSGSVSMPWMIERALVIQDASLGILKRFVNLDHIFQKVFGLRQLAHMEASHRETAFTPAREIEFFFDIVLEILAGRDGLDMGCDLRLESPFEFGKKIVRLNIPTLAACPCSQAAAPANHASYTRLEERNDKAIQIDGFGAARSAEHTSSQIPTDRLEEKVRIEEHQIWMALHHVSDKRFQESS
jgi:hypothetical protein